MNQDSKWIFYAHQLLLPHTLNCSRFCFWHRQSVVFLFGYETSLEPLKKVYNKRVYNKKQKLQHFIYT